MGFGVGVGVGWGWVGDCANLITSVCDQVLMTYIHIQKVNKYRNIVPIIMSSGDCQNAYQNLNLSYADDCTYFFVRTPEIYNKI